jgi:alpha-beta hydrolase superfamily lysophospholipase
MKRRKFFIILVRTLGVVFVVANAIAFFHAYKLTHFDPSAKERTKSPGKLSFAQKLGVVFFGISNPRPRNSTPPGVPYETVILQSNRRIECWFIPAPASRGTVILFHGYGGEKSGMLDKAEVFRGLGYSTLLADFMGAGGSEGDQTTIGFKEAAQVSSCTAYMKKRGEGNIILFGTSLGAAAVMKALSDTSLPVSGVILECPFSTMLNAVRSRFTAVGVPSFPMAQLLLFWGGVQNGFNGFSHNPIAYAKSIKCPVLFFYGEKDAKVTRVETDAIFANLGGPKTLVTFPEAAHENYLLKYREEWSRQVGAFLAKQ